MILLDANILMYAGGTTHPHKEPSAELLARIARGEVDAALDAEVLQEILHRYRALGRWEDGRRLYDTARRVVLVVLPITAGVMDEARAIMDEYPRLMARDALHAAVYRVVRAEALCSYDEDFDGIGALRRVEPSGVR